MYAPFLDEIWFESALTNQHGLVPITELCADNKTVQNRKMLQGSEKDTL